MRSDRIYPVPIKPATAINSWDAWPQDVVGLLREWNSCRGGHRLTFAWFGESSVFKCPDCDEFCERHQHGAARLDEVDYCDDCLIARARADHPRL